CRSRAPDGTLPAPSRGTTQRWFAIEFLSRLTSVTENMTHLPDGEIWGSLTRFIRCKSANVIGLFPDKAFPPTPCAQPPAHVPASATPSTPVQTVRFIIATVYPRKNRKNR